jgi:hypothetical protein
MEKGGTHIIRGLWVNMLFIIFSIPFAISCGGGGSDGGDGPNPNNSSPVVQIINPTEGSGFAVGDEIQFEADCDDNEDGYFNDSALVWRSDLDGEIGRGESCTSDALTVGNHSITLTATDSQGATGTDTVTITVSAFKANGWIPDTGQVISYTDTLGEDSDYDIRPPHYTKLDAYGNAIDASATQWAMVRDDVTGLIWEIKTDDGSVHDRNNTYTHEDAKDLFVARLNSENFCGHADWRLPTVNELSYLVHADANNPAIDTAYFSNTTSAKYWTSTLYPGHTDIAWNVDFSQGLVFSQYITEYYNARAVRGGPSSSNFIDNGDGTVTDASTGLMWQQDQAGDMLWDAALVYCERLVLAGYDDWRLPNRNELQSLLDYSVIIPSIDTTMFLNTMSKEYWTSTTALAGPNCPIKYAYCVGFGSGGVGVGLNSESLFSVRAVRGGQ